MATSKPVISERDIFDLVNELYGLKIVSITKFDGYDDLNLYVKVDRGVCTNSHIQCPAPDGYVLKISNSRFTEDPDSITAQNSVMLFLNDHLRDVEVPVPVQTVTGQYWNFVRLPWKTGSSNGVELNGHHESTHIVRLLTFTRGTILETVPTEPGRRTLEHIGKLVGELSRVMKKFNGRGVPEKPTDIWALENVGHLTSRLDAVDDAEKLTVFQEVISQFDSYLNLHRHTLDHGVIHGDINEANIIIDHKDGDDSKFHLKGLIDFCDSHRTCKIFDLVLAITYMMLECSKKRHLLNIDPLEAGAYVLAGYLQENSITQSEVHILKIGIEARITQSLVLGLHTFKHHEPGNLYLLRTQKHGWQILHLLRQMTERQLFAKWKSFLPNLPGSFPID